MNIFFNISVLCFGFMAVLLGIMIYLKRRDRLLTQAIEITNLYDAISYI